MTTSSTTIPLDPTTITASTITKLLTLYPIIHPLIHAQKYQSSKSKPKLNAAEALADDTWRYTTLPNSLSPGTPLTKSDLTRLMQWKLTHGIFRPFLQSQISKNTDAEIQAHSSRASTILSRLPASSPSKTDSEPSSNDDDDDADRYKIIKAALDEICLLKGVGPATGSLVLSVYKSDQVPFFGDEVYAWICGGLKPDLDGNGFDAKALGLKYDFKEYKRVWEGVRGIVRRCGGEGNEIRAKEVERVAYVVLHLELVGRGKVEKLGLDLGGDAGRESVVEDGNRDEGGEVADEKNDQEEQERGEHDGQISPRDSSNRKRRAAKSDESQSTDAPRRSKRGRT